MKTTLLFLIFSLCALVAQAQPSSPELRYTSIAAGNWTNPAIWAVSDARGNPQPSSFPAPNANNVVTVNHDVRLNIDYDVSGNEGMLTLNQNGYLSHTGQYTLFVGDQSGSVKSRISVEARPSGNVLNALNLYKLNFYKAEGTISAPIQTASCLTIGNSTSLLVPTVITINGNLIITQGNTSADGFDGGRIGVILVNGVIDGSQSVLRNYAVIIQVASPTVSGDCNVVVPLPVELTSFTALFGNNQVNLRWATASEKNSANFTVERSFDGKTFSAVTTVRAAGTATTPHEYTATDRGMRNGLNYYRLKQTDLDGTFTYTQVLPVQVGAVEQQLQAYGDNGSLNIVLHTAGTLQLLRVLDSMGRVVYTESPKELATGVFTRRIPMTSASSRRMYIVQAVTSQGVLNEKFMVAE